MICFHLISSTEAFMATKSWRLIMRNVLITLFFSQGLWCTLPSGSEARETDDDFMDSGEYALEEIRVERSLSPACPRGWNAFGQKCYKIIQNQHDRKNWRNAKLHCEQLDSTLVSIHSKREQDFLSSLMLKLRKNVVWIGLHRTIYRGKFVWADHSPLDYTNWNRDKHNRLSDEKECVQMIHTNKTRWNYDKCGKWHPFICQKHTDQEHHEFVLAQENQDGLVQEYQASGMGSGEVEVSEIPVKVVTPDETEIGDETHFFSDYLVWVIMSVLLMIIILAVCCYCFCRSEKKRMCKITQLKPGNMECRNMTPRCTEAYIAKDTELKHRTEVRSCNQESFV